MQPKRYKAYKLIPRIRSHLRSRYNVPEDLIKKIDFSKVIKDGMTMKEAYIALVKAYPELKKYLEKREEIRELEVNVEENLEKKGQILHELVREAEEGKEEAINTIKELIRKAIVEKDPEAIELIKVTYNLSPGAFAHNVLIPRGIITERYLNELIAEMAKERPPPAVSPEYAEYERAITDLAKEIRELKSFLSKFTIEDLRKVGVKGFQAILDKYIAAIRTREEKLEQLKEKIPEKAEEIERQIKRAEREIEKARRVLEGFKPYDVEYLIDQAVERIVPKIKRVVEEAISREVAPIRRAAGELMPQEWKWCCTCYYGDGRLAVKFLENKAICRVHAMELEEEWAKEGIQPQWNPDDMGVCTECGRMVKLFRCSGGLIYCLECAEELSDRLVFDDEFGEIQEKARRSIARVMRMHELYR